MNPRPVCLLIGAGAGIGGSVARRFAAAGYHSVLCRRTDDEGLRRLIADIEESGGSASGSLLDATAEGSIEGLVDATERDHGPIAVAVFNLGAQVGNRALADTPLKTFERCWQLASFGLFRLATALLPRMAARGSGTLLVTSATAAVRGNPGQHAHAAAMGARRMLCQTLNAEFGPQGIHVAQILIDGMVDAPDTLGRMLGPAAFATLREQVGGNDGLLLPEQIAETYYHLALQHRSAWTHELDLRPWTEKPWWNSG